jgi:outer membrane lipoprotein
MNRLRYVMLTILLSSCASNIPEQISSLPAQEISISEIQRNPDQFTGMQVRWGGVINKVENQATQTRVEIVSKGLNNSGKPEVDSSSNGRFIASFTGFIDPIIYKKGEYITIVGKIEGVDVALIGEYAYSYPIVKVDSEYLWKELDKEKDKEYHPSYRHDYDPWPYYRRTYYRRPY